MDGNDILWQGSLLVFAAFVGAIISNWFSQFWDTKKLWISILVLFLSVIVIFLFVILVLLIFANIIFN